jgi:hypothetical protein
VRPCQGRLPDELCDGEPFCVHFCYDELSRDAMAAAISYDYDFQTAPGPWQARVCGAVRRQLHPLQLVQCGFTAELFAYCQVSLRDLLVQPGSVRARAPAGRVWLADARAAPARL